ncbi:MAG TPA: DUF2007 domain-containing protein [Solirubrobacterales bacterium]
MATGEGPLACPHCAIRYALDQRFCAECGMPLAYVGQGELEPITDAHERARKVKPQYTRGELVRVAGGRNLAEAELIQGILLEEGIPSLQKRTRGFDVPDFLAAGPRDIFVPESAAEDARELLTGAEIDPAGQANGTGATGGASPLGTDAGPTPVKLLAWILIVLAIGSGLLGLVYALGG